MPASSVADVVSGLPSPLRNTTSLAWGLLLSCLTGPNYAQTRGGRDGDIGVLYCSFGLTAPSSTR